MGQPAAKQGDKVMAVDTHILLVPTPAPAPPTPVPLPHPFSGTLTGGLSTTVKIGGKAAAVVGSTGDQHPRARARQPGGAVPEAAGEQGRRCRCGSPTVKINGKPAARNGDAAMTCNDPADQPVGKIVAVGDGDDRMTSPGPAGPTPRPRTSSAAAGRSPSRSTTHGRGSR